jgi:hypothetical protein
VLNGEKYELELEDIPPFEEEPFGPPPGTLKPKVQFWYTASATEPNVFWNRVAHEWADLIEPFIGDSREVREAAAALVAGAATPDEKLRKLFARAQQIRNTSFEPEKSENESRKLRDNHRTQDVLCNGYGGLTDINRLFVAMARGRRLRCPCCPSLGTAIAADERGSAVLKR